MRATTPRADADAHADAQGAAWYLDPRSFSVRATLTAAVEEARLARERAAAADAEVQATAGCVDMARAADAAAESAMHAEQAARAEAALERDAAAHVREALTRVQASLEAAEERHAERG